MPINKIVTLTCPDCGLIFTASVCANRTKRCPDCQRERNRRNVLARYYENRDRRRNIPRNTWVYLARLADGYPEDDYAADMRGRRFPWYEMHDMPAGFLPEGMILEARAEGRLVKTGQVIDGLPRFDIAQNPQT